MTRCARVPIAQQLAPFSMACPMHGHGGTVQTAVNVVTTEEPRTVSYARIGLDEAVMIAIMETFGRHAPRRREAAKRGYLKSNPLHLSQSASHMGRLHL